MNLFGFNIGRKKRSTNSTYPFSVTNVNGGLTLQTPDATSQACVDLICSTIGSLPLDLFNRANREKQSTHPLYKVFKEPNADETRSIFFYNMVKDYINGNVYLYKYYDDQGDIAALFRLDPNAVTVTRDDFNKKVFTYKNTTYDYTTILHIPSRWGYDGTKGQSIFQAAKETFTMTKELDTFTNNAFNNSLGKRLIIDISNAFPNATPEQIEALRLKYIASYTGPENTGKPIIKSNKVEFNAIESGLPDNRSSQLMENRSFQESEIAKLFGVPLSFLKGENKYGDIEALYQVFLDTAIKPITTSFEESFNKLLPYSEKETMYFEFNYNTMLRTSLTARIDSYTKQLTSGILSINEVRSMENKQPIEAGDTNIISGGNYLILTQENLDAYMAKNKADYAKTQQHSPLGDDKL
jgi:HK97 family phage portal protein